LPSLIKRWVITNGELRLWLGWAQEVTGDHAAAQESWRRAPGETGTFSQRTAGKLSLLGDLALTNMGLSDKVAAFKLIRAGHGRNPRREGPV